MRPLSLHGGTGAPLQAAHKQYRLGGFRQHVDRWLRLDSCRRRRLPVAPCPIFSRLVRRPWYRYGDDHPRAADREASSYPAAKRAKRHLWPRGVARFLQRGLIGNRQQNVQHKFS
jgi:hypothetical protein